MSAPDFYFAINDIFKHIHDRFGRDALVQYWRDMGRDHYAQRWQAWQRGGLPAIADDWRDFFQKEPGADVHITTTPDRVTLEIHTCPAIAHIRKHKRDLAPWFCQHCDVITSAMANPAGFAFARQGGGGSCTQHFTPLTTHATDPATSTSSSSSSSTEPAAAIAPTATEDSHARLS